MPTQKVLLIVLVQHHYLAHCVSPPSSVSCGREKKTFKLRRLHVKGTLWSSAVFSITWLIVWLWSTVVSFLKDSLFSMLNKVRCWSYLIQKYFCITSLLIRVTWCVHNSVGLVHLLCHVSIPFWWFPTWCIEKISGESGEFLESMVPSLFDQINLKAIFRLAAFCSASRMTLLTS